MAHKILISAETGGRCSNAVALVGNLLQLHPCIEIIDGRLIAGKKYRGQLAKAASALLREFAAKHQLETDHLYFIHTPYMRDDVREALNAEASALGFHSVTWIKTGCVITCHGGPGAFGIVGTTSLTRSPQRAAKSRPFLFSCRAILPCNPRRAVV